MSGAERGLPELLDIVAQHLDIPESYYQKAAARHRSLTEWLNRPASSLLRFHPDVRPQGSFRYGTVTRPLDATDEYDLDNVSLLTGIHITDVTQEQLKVMYGAEMKGYALAQGMLHSPEEHNRCWRLRYADEVGFHLDSLPSLPAQSEFVRDLERLGVIDRFANAAIAITDRHHPAYRSITLNWLRSNPRGFARWFESRAALGREAIKTTGPMARAGEDVPPYQWKTTLQRSIQLLKRHRDVMFRKATELAPISIIITNLAARAYTGERNLAQALENILDAMPALVNPVSPRVPNPALPSEDYADKWQRDSRLEHNFWLWHQAASADLKNLAAALESGTATRRIEEVFAVTISMEESQVLLDRYRQRARVTPAVIVSSGPKPWGVDKGAR